MRVLERFAILATVFVCACVASAQVDVPKNAKQISAKYYKIGGKIKAPKPVAAPEPSISKADREILKREKKGRNGIVVDWNWSRRIG